MPQSIVSALKSCIRFIQLKLSDFVDGLSSVDKILTERFIDRNKPRHVTKELILLADNHFELLHPVCPTCDSDRVTKQEYRRRTPILGECGLGQVYLRRYQCTSCGKKFITPLDAVVERCHRYTSVFKDVATNLTKTGYRSLRRVKEDLATFFGIAPSHQSILNWLEVSDKRRIKGTLRGYSKYYCYDEQHIEIGRRKKYRLTLFDTVLNIPMAEDIADDSRYETVRAFLEDALRDRPLFAVTTNHKRD